MAPVGSAVPFVNNPSVVAAAAAAYKRKREREKSKRARKMKYILNVLWENNLTQSNIHLL